MNPLKTALGRFRMISLIEAISFIFLLYCSLYLKRMLGQPEAIRLPGLVHGILFCIYCPALWQAKEEAQWSMKTTILVFLSSLIPIVPLFIDSWLKREEKRVHKDPV